MALMIKIAAYRPQKDEQKNYGEKQTQNTCFEYSDD